MRLRDLLSAAVVLFAPAFAQAHPHVWVDTASEVIFDGKGRIAAIRHHWRFDEAFSAYALQGLDINRDGVYSPEELEPLARENVESVAEFDFFTFLSVGDYLAGFAAPKDYYLDYDGGQLTLHFTLPLALPLFSRSSMLLEIYDPEYYVAFSLPTIEAVRLVDPPDGCRLSVRLAEEPDPAAAQALATIGADQRELPPEMRALTGGIENSAEIDCGGAAVAGEADQPSRTAADALSEMAQTSGAPGDLTALPSAPAAEARAPAASGGFMARIAALQAAFNRDLTEALKGLKSGGAFWWLGGISFLYGIVHAAGPGHGKVVISSYLVANEARVRRGVAIAFLAAFVQALVAVGIVGLMAVILNMTSMAITGTAKAFEAGSFALVAALGLYLLARKTPQAWAALRGGDPRAHHRHGEPPSRLWGGVAPRPLGAAAVAHVRHHGSHPDALHRHDHACTQNAVPAELEKPGLSGAAAAIVSVGIRPCSGALVVLVFALAQGIFWAGVASTFLMALGTALTVAVLAALAVGAKDLARRISNGGDGRSSGQLMLGLELLAALFIAALGAVLFAGALQA